MISAIIILILSCSVCCSGQYPTITVGDDQSNWAEMLKTMNKSKSDGRSDLAIGVFERILRANAIARGQGTGRSGSNGFLYQGDILLNRSEIRNIVNVGSSRRKRAVGKTSAVRRWERDNIAYALTSSLGGAIPVIRQAVRDWETILNCMGKWKDVTSSVNKPRNYMQFFKGAGCYSHVGRQVGRQTVSIGAGCEYRGIVVHEIGHALGFWHEQSRPDRDNHVQINWKNIIPAMKFNFNKYSTSQIDSLGVAYDYESIMHYGSRAFSVNGYPTIQVKGNSGIRLGQRRGLSSKDKEQARLMYGCKAVIVGCKDTKTSCPRWGKAGYCNTDKYEVYMKRECCKTCQSTGSCKVKTITKGECCVFPFQYKNKQYNNCITIDNKNTLWCATTSNFDIDGKWGNCNGVSPCDSSPCMHGGTCSNQRASFKCRCRSGFKGIKCEQQILPCDSSPCLNGGSCTNQRAGFKCTCTSGFKGLRCEQKRSCKVKTITKGECCVFPFQYKNKQYNNCITIDNKNTLWCATTSNFDIDGKWGNCNGVSPCDSSPCMHGGACSNQGAGFKCRCRSGFKGLRCEQKDCTKDISKSVDCIGWKASGFCESTSKWSGFMIKNCCFTCQSISDCKDKNKFCKQWANMNFCTHKKWANSMKIHCAKACGC